MVPDVFENTNYGERKYDLFSRLLNDRIILLGENITRESANVVIAQMLFLEAQNPEKEIRLYVNSPGGELAAGFAVYDTMRYIKCQVSTVCIGLAADIAAVILAGGTKGKRKALQNAEIMICQPGIDKTVRGDASDVQIMVEHILQKRQRLYRTLAENTGRSIEQISDDIKRERFMSASEALQYGMIDSIVI